MGSIKPGIPTISISKEELSMLNSINTLLVFADEDDNTVIARIEVN